MEKFYAEGLYKLIISISCCTSYSIIVLQNKGSSEWKAEAKHFCSTRLSFWQGKMLVLLIRSDVHTLLQVGVGTCNTGGKGMTDFTIPAKNVTTKH